MTASSPDPKSWHKTNKVEGFYIPAPNEAIYVCRHEPISEAKNKTVIICPPIGYEYNHSYRSLRYLAEHLCSQGFTVFRFDYYGTGNSEGSVLDSHCQERWIENILALSLFVHNSYPSSKQTWIGVRLGASLAALALQKQFCEPELPENITKCINSIESLILWEPIIKGRAYIRELQAIARLSEYNQNIDDSIIESAGFILSHDTAEKIKSINLQKTDLSSIKANILLIKRNDKPIDESFSNHLSEQGVNVNLTSLDGFVGMMEEPHKTTVPSEAISRITSYLNSFTANSLEKSQKVAYSSSLTFHLQGADIVEEAIYFGKDCTLFGILSKPKLTNKNSHRCIILSNSGAVHHVGPNAIYTLVARELAAMGFYVFRLDLENLGDSQITDSDNENHPYQPHALENIKTAIDFLRHHSDIKTFTICGICSGAYTAFHAGIKSNELPVSEILMINPLTFYWDPSQSLETNQNMFKDQAYYQQSLYSIEKWKKLFSGQANISYVAQFIIRRILKLAQEKAFDIWSLITGEKSKLANDLFRIHKQNTAISFIFSSTDPGLAIVKSEANRTLKQGLKDRWISLDIIDNADHTLSSNQAKNKLIKILNRHYKTQP